MPRKGMVTTADLIRERMKNRMLMQGAGQGLGGDYPGPYNPMFVPSAQSRRAGTGPLGPNPLDPRQMQPPMLGPEPPPPPNPWEELDFFALEEAINKEAEMRDARKKRGKKKKGKRQDIFAELDFYELENLIEQGLVGDEAFGGM